MKRKGHKHKESFSLLLLSNSGRKNRQWHVSKAVFCLLSTLLLLICIAVGVMGYMLYQVFSTDAKQEDLRAQLEEQKQLAEQLKAENEELSNAKQRLETELETYSQSADAGEEEAEEKTGEETEADSESGIPRRYPSSGTSTLVSSYTEEQPYLSINTHEEGNIVATGDGTVTAVTSDDDYPVIVEVEHAKNYKTRYMCRQAADVQATRGAQVEAGDILFTITTEDTQLDYQILFEDEPIDPLTVIEAQG